MNRSRPDGQILPAQKNLPVVVEGSAEMKHNQNHELLMSQWFFLITCDIPNGIRVAYVAYHAASHTNVRQER